MMNFYPLLITRTINILNFLTFLNSPLLISHTSPVTQVVLIKALTFLLQFVLTQIKTLSLFPLTQLLTFLLKRLPPLQM